MKLTKYLLIAGATVSLSACANQCLDTSDYEQVPYAPERTAGEGIAIYDANCPTTTAVKQTTMKKADPVFTQSVRK